MKITQAPLIRSRWTFLWLLPCMFACQWWRRHSVMWHLWRQPWWHRRHGKCRMTQTFTRQGYGPVCEFLLGYFLLLYALEVEEFNGMTFRTLTPPVDLENPVWTGSTRFLRLPIFFPGGILWYHLYLCFRGQRIQWWHFQNSTTTGWTWKSSLNRNYWIFEVTYQWWKFQNSTTTGWPQKSSSRNMGNLEVPVLPVRIGFSRSRDSDMNVKICPLDSSTSKI